MDNNCKDEWVDMPEYNNIKEPKPEFEFLFRFRNEKDYNEFHNLIKERIYDGDQVLRGAQRKNKKSAWYPALDKPGNYRYE